MFFSFSAVLELDVPREWLRGECDTPQRGDCLAGLYAEHSIQNTSVCQAFALLDQLIGGVFQIPGRMSGLVLRVTLRAKVPFALVVKVTLIVEDT